MKIVYLAGYGRSGTTLLEKVLSSQTGITGLGEVGYLPDEILNSKTKCSCGMNYQNCPMWGTITKNISSREWENLRSGQRILESKGPWKWYHFPFDKPRSAYRSFCDNLIAELHTLPSDVFIDSTKTTYTSCLRPYHLYKMGINLKVIHVVRDLRGVIWSMMKRGLNRHLTLQNNKKAFAPVARSLVGWKTANSWAETTRTFLNDDQYLLIRYEDFVDNPMATIRIIGQFVDFPFDGLDYDSIDGFSTKESHLVGGNRMKFSNTIRIQKDTEWEHGLPKQLNRIAWLFAHKELHRFGYRR